MTYVGRGHCSRTVSITGVATACERRAQFVVLCVHGRNVGVFARAGLMDRCWAIWTGGIEFGGAVEIWYQWGEGSVRSVACHTSAGRGRYVAVLPRVRLWRQEGGMLG